MKEKRRQAKGGPRVLDDAQSRGLLLLLAIALLAAGLVEVLPYRPRTASIERQEFTFEDVDVILPIYESLGCVDVNAASADELTRLPGIGPVLAARIVADRTENGPFHSPDDLARVSGIGPSTVDGLRSLVCSEPDG